MNDDLYLTADETREWVLDFYRTSWAHAAVTFEECDLDTVGRVPWWGDRGEVTLHQILVHMVAETEPPRRPRRHRPGDHRRSGRPEARRRNIDDGYDWPAYVARVTRRLRSAGGSSTADLTPPPGARPSTPD